MPHHQPHVLHGAVVTCVAIEAGVNCLLSNPLTCRWGRMLMLCSGCPWQSFYPPPQSWSQSLFLHVEPRASAGQRAAWKATQMIEQLNLFLWVLCILVKWIHQHLVLSQDPTYAVPTAVLYRLFFEMLQISRSCGCREPHLWPAGCLPCSQMSYFCPAELWRWGQDKERVTAGVGVLLLGIWLSLLAGTAPAEDTSSFAASALFWVILLSPQVILSPLSQPGSLRSKKLLQSSGKAVCFPHLGSFSCSCTSGYTAQFSSIPTPCPHYPARQITEWRERRRAGCFLLNPYWKSQAN